LLGYYLVPMSNMTSGAVALPKVVLPSTWAGPSGSLQDMGVQLGLASPAHCPRNALTY
jgi:hypothetical protein